MLFEENRYLNKLKNFFSLSSWIILGFSFFLTGIVAIAQASVPGDLTYGIKTGFEKAVLVGYKFFNLDTRYQIDLTELRFVETQKIIKSGRAVLGLNSLLKQILSTENSIYRIKDPQQRTNLARQYISQLTDINYQLELDKSNQTFQSPIGRSPTLIPTIAMNNPSQSDVNDQITLTRQQIQDIINRLNNVSNQQPPPPPPTPTQPPTDIPTPTLEPTQGEGQGGSTQSSQSTSVTEPPPSTEPSVETPTPPESPTPPPGKQE